MRRSSTTTTNIHQLGLCLSTRRRRWSRGQIQLRRCHVTATSKLTADTTPIRSQITACRVVITVVLLYNKESMMEPKAPTISPRAKTPALNNPMPVAAGVLIGRQTAAAAKPNPAAFREPSLYESVYGVTNGVVVDFGKIGPAGFTLPDPGENGPSPGIIGLCPSPWISPRGSVDVVG